MAHDHAPPRQAGRDEKTDMDGGVDSTSTGKPSAAQRKWLMRGLTQAGGKLPLFDGDGRSVLVLILDALIHARPK